MESFESVCNRLIKQPSFWTSILIGSLISAIPVVNIFALGYLRRMINEQDDTSIPMWDFSVQNLKYNFLEGLNVFIFLLIFLLIPMLIGGLFGMCLSLTFGSLSLFFAYVAFLIGLPTSVYALLLVSNPNELSSMQIVFAMFKRTINTYRSLFIPTFLFLLLIVLGVQFLPLAMMEMPLFFGLVFMIAFMKNLKIVND